MKKLLFAATITLSLGATSCKKESATTTAQIGGLGTINVNVNGKSESFNTSATASYIFTITTGSYIYINGWNGQENHSDNIQLALVTLAPPFKKGTNFSDSSSVNNEDMIYSGIDGSYTSIADGATKVTITSIDSTSIQGQFSGVIRQTSLTNVIKTDTLTNGTFNVPLQ